MRPAGVSRKARHLRVATPAVADLIAKAADYLYFVVYMNADADVELGGRRRTVMTPTEAQKRLVIVGATGMVGGHALRCALDHPAVATATATAIREFLQEIV